MTCSSSFLFQYQRKIFSWKNKPKSRYLTVAAIVKLNTRAIQKLFLCGTPSFILPCMLSSLLVNFHHNSCNFISIVTLLDFPINLKIIKILILFTCVWCLLLKQSQKSKSGIKCLVNWIKLKKVIYALNILSFRA